MIPRPRRASFLPSASQTSEGADYRVPLISVPDILGFCAQMDIDLAQEDLVAPTSARIQLNLMALIEIFLPWRFEIMEHEVTKALDRFDNAVNSHLISNIECVSSYLSIGTCRGSRSFYHL